MYFDKTYVKVIGSKWNEKKKKHDKDIIVGTHTCNDGMSDKKFMSLLNELSDAHDANDIIITVELKQHQY
tara:strand:- start:208 stop:417 length:210 start_codon:yes stop_codon:yes gene_type:complete